MAAPQSIFINLPVVDVAKSKSFYESIGFTNNKQFSDDTTACMVLTDTIYVMIMTHARWATFTPKAVPDLKKYAPMMIALSRDSRAAVDAIIEAAKKGGGVPDPQPAQDHGFMYGRSFEDPNGHHWEAIWMDPATIAKS